MGHEPHKRCQTCREVKDHCEFLPTRYTASGVTDNCKSCIFSNARRNREQREQRNANRASAAP